MQVRRREGLKSFPAQPRTGPVCPTSGRTRHAAADHAPNEADLAPSVGRLPCRHIAYAGGRTFAQQQAPGGLHLRAAFPARTEPLR